jgi:hypothetical protein
MPRVNTVEHARKDYPEAGIKKGDKYYWWKFRYGGKHMSTTPPKASQLTQSSFLSQLYEIQERLQSLEATDAESLKYEVDEIACELRNLSEECENNRSNMPDGLQEGEVGQMLESRAEACSSAADELEGIDFDIDEEALIEEAKEELAQEYEDENKFLSENEAEVAETVAEDLGSRYTDATEAERKELVKEELESNKEENEKLRKEIEEKIPELVEDKKQERLDEIIGEIQNISIDCE